MQSIQQVRDEHKNVQSASSDRIAVIVSTPVNARKSQMGVQFWTPEMIAVGSSKNTDGSISVYIDIL